jgi:MOSC domain-containing protein YiiM
MDTSTAAPDRDLDQHLDAIRAAPRDAGRVELIVRRPDQDEREALDEGVIDLEHGLVGDGWKARGNRHTPDGSADADAQLTLMSTRVLAAIEPDAARWPLAGDQIYVDLDLSEANLPVGTRLAVGTAVVEVTAKPHTGCAKFTERFGSDATRWINNPVGRSLRLRGMNVRVLEAGTVRVGDGVRKA